MSVGIKTAFPLDASSLVFDLGAYVGGWCSEIARLYRCRIMAFEPVAEFASRISGERIEVFVHGLGPSTITALINVNKDSSSIYVDGASTPIQIVSIGDFLSANAITSIDLMKINIEGGEFDLFDYMIATGLIPCVRHFLIQFHSFMPNAAAIYAYIVDRLMLTHDLVSTDPWKWDHWVRR